MQIVHEKRELRALVRDARRQGRTIGFVPTMGYLHDGHLSLIRRARRENEVVVASIFVNPTQFGPNEDLEAYPRDIPRDISMMRSEGTDIAFFPTVEALYPQGYVTYVNVEGPLTATMCARSRPTHFRGVATIVTKLFNLVEPDRAYFGQKDAQQAAVIRQMVRDLDFDIDIVVCPIVREADGLAMSSRNAYLSPQERSRATVLSRSLFKAAEDIKNGERDAHALLQRIRGRIREVPGAELDYAAAVDAHSLLDLHALEGDVLIAVAVRFGRTRLIDNICVALA